MTAQMIAGSGVFDAGQMSFPLALNPYQKSLNQSGAKAVYLAVDCRFLCPK